MLRKPLSLTLVVTLTLYGWAWAAPTPLAAAPAEPTADADIEATTRELVREARRLRPLLDRSQFDLDALLARLDYDPERIARFVSEEIALEVCAGVLRGARGTLISRAGNSAEAAGEPAALRLPTDWSALHFAFDSAVAARDGILGYRHAPNLVAMSRALLPRPDQREGHRIDILSNARRSVAVPGGRLEPAPAQLVLAGVWETQIETDLIARPGASEPRPPASLPALRAFAASEVEPFARGGSVAAGMLRDLEEGYVVLADRALDLESRTDETRWWRVDPSSGETLGMNRYGGSEGVMYALLLSVDIVFLGAAYLYCAPQWGPVHCRVCNTVRAHPPGSPSSRDCYPRSRSETT